MSKNAERRKEITMANQISTNVTVSGLGQRQQTIVGRLAANRHLRGVAIIGALALALAASLAISRAWASDPALSSAPGQYPIIQQDPDADAHTMAQQARPADTFDFEQWERTQTGGAAGIPIDVAVGNAAAFCPGDCQLGVAGATDTTGGAVVPGFSATREDHRPVVGPAYTFPEVYGDDGAAAPRGVPTSPAYQFPAMYGDDEAR